MAKTSKAPLGKRAAKTKRRASPSKTNQSKKKLKRDGGVSPSAQQKSGRSLIYEVLELETALVWAHLKVKDRPILLDACVNGLSEEFSTTLALTMIDEVAAIHETHLGWGCACDWMRNLDFLRHAEEKCTLRQPFGASKDLPMLRTSRAACDLLNALLVMTKVMNPLLWLGDYGTIFAPVVCPLTSEEYPRPKTKNEITGAMNCICPGAGTRFFYKFTAKRKHQASGADFLDRHWNRISKKSCGYCDWISRPCNCITAPQSICRNVYRPLKASMEINLEHVRFIPKPRRERGPYMLSERFEGLVAGITKDKVLCGVYLVNGYWPPRHRGGVKKPH